MLAALLVAVLVGLAAPSPAGAAEPPSIVQFWLVDTDTDTRITQLSDYDRLILPVLPDHLSIEAEANGETESVSMRIEGVESALENNAPYALGSDVGGDFNPVPQLQSPGWLTVSARPFGGPDGGGTAGTEAFLHLYLHEPDFVVTHGNDSGDTNPGDGVCKPIYVPTPGLTTDIAKWRELAVQPIAPELIENLKKVELEKADKAGETDKADKGDRAKETDKAGETDKAEKAEKADKAKETDEAGETKADNRKLVAVDVDMLNPDLINPSVIPLDDLDWTIEKIKPGPCTLRAAIEEANALPGRQSILVLGDRGPFDIEHGHLVVDDGVDIEGYGPRAVIDAGKRSRIFYLTGNHLVNMRHLDLTGGSPGAAERGGAIWVDNDTHLQMSDSIVRDSRANFGGGIYLQNGGDLTLRSSAIRDNIAGTPDDGFGGGGVTQRGGGIFNLKGVVKIIDSSVFHNLAVRGGGLSNAGGTMRVENSSVIDNESLAIGGGIENHHAGDDKGNLHLAFATVANNQAGTSNAAPASHRVGGGLYNSGWAYMASSILADNTDGWAAGDANHAPDCHSPDPYDFKSYRHNVVGVLNGNCDLGDYSSGSTAWIDHGTEGSPLDPGLTGFAMWDHRGYRNIVASSVAIDGGASTTASLYPCADHDMRDRTRPVGGGCDIGAVERQ